MSRLKPANVDAAESEVMAARQQLTESIETLSQNFSSSGLIDRLVDLDPEQGRAQLSSLVRVARANPVPFLLIGAGLASLLMKPVVRKGLKRRKAGAKASGRTAGDQDRAALRR